MTGCYENWKVVASVLSTLIRRLSMVHHLTLSLEDYLVY